MDVISQSVLRRQLSAAIDMLESAIQRCPEDLWSGRLWRADATGAGSSAFWYIAYHTLFWLDFYLSDSSEGFAPPEPFSLSELDPCGTLPDRQYKREELLSYLSHCRRKCEREISDLTPVSASRLCSFPWLELTYGELLLDNMRHVQEHAAQLSMYLGQEAGMSANWVSGR